MSDALSVTERRNDILGRVAAAAKWAERSVDDISVVAVSKMQPDERVAAMLDTGHSIFGENRVQEAQKRWGETFSDHRDALELRLIGPLQTNKAQDAVELFDVIETVDREKLVKALLKAGDKVGRLPKLFVQVNTGEEPQKAGIMPQDVSAFLRLMKTEYDLIPAGLMCIPPQGEAVSPHFWFLDNLAADHGLRSLSMGMSGDFETAIKMGATHIRVGSAFFGERP